MDLKGLPFFTGVAIYCYEGAGMILSLEASIAKDYRSRFKVTLLLVPTKLKNLSVYLFNGNYGNDSALYFVWSLWISLVRSWYSRNHYFEFTCWSNAFDCERMSLLFFIFHISSYAFPCWLVERDTTARMRWPNTDQELLKIISVEIIERRIGIQGSVMKGNILRAGLVLITIVTVCIITDFSTIMVLIGATCCSLLGKCLIISPRFPSRPTRDPRTVWSADRSMWGTFFRGSGAWVPDRTSFVQHIKLLFYQRLLISVFSEIAWQNKIKLRIIQFWFLALLEQ